MKQEEQIKIYTFVQVGERYIHFEATSYKDAENQLSGMNESDLHEATSFFKVRHKLLDIRSLP